MSEEEKPVEQPNEEQVDPKPEEGEAKVEETNQEEKQEVPPAPAEDYYN